MEPCLEQRVGNCPEKPCLLQGSQCTVFRSSGVIKAALGVVQNGRRLVGFGFGGLRQDFSRYGAQAGLELKTDLPQIQIQSAGITELSHHVWLMAIVLHCEAHWMVLGGQWGYIPANPLHAENLLSRG